MTFIEQCINDSLPIWEDCLSGSFLRQLANGSLPENCFQGYIVDDSLYLREYSKVFAWGIIRARDMDEVRNFYSMLSFVNEAEDSTRRYYLKRYRLTDQEIQSLPLRAENQAYVDAMHSVAQAGGVAECMMACLPCMLSYGWIFGELLQRTPQVKETVYGRFVSDYAGERYNTICEKWIYFAEKACLSLSSDARAHCLRIFRDCSMHELRFWEMSARPRVDIAAFQA